VYEIHAEEITEPSAVEKVVPEEPVAPVAPPVVETLHSPSSPTRVWEAVQPPRPAPSLEALSVEDEHDELDVPAYLRKKNTDLS
jgi:hypothetical protein